MENMKAIISNKSRFGKIHLINSIGIAMCNKIRLQSNYSEIEINSKDIDQITKPLYKSVCKSCWVKEFQVK